jgi:hypothetical protein
MDTLLMDFRCHFFALDYVDDDIICFSDDFSSHLMHLQSIFQRLIAAKLKFKPSKCFLFEDEIDYLGFKVSATGVTATSDKIEAIKALKPTTSKSQVRTFLGICNYYRSSFCEGVC